MLSIRKIGVIRRGYRHLNRYRQIVSVLIKYGFDDLIDTLKIEQYFEMGLGMISRKERPPVERFTRAERIRMALEELGPTFVKLGQILATRPDLVSAEFVQEFEKLQDHVPPFAYEEVREIIEKELGQNVEGLFESLDEEPLAAASIGQVHRARLKDGEEVVVKIQRPGIRKVIEVDLEIMLHLASLMERHVEEMEMHRPTRIVAEFARSIEKEIDYTIEASHMERFAAQFQGDMSIYVPKVFREWSTDQVLTVEFIDGIKASEIDRIDGEGLDRKVITARGADLILKQIFEHGFFHADPHPGNIYVLPDNMICYLDYGMMGRIDRQTREDAAELIHALSRGDESKTMHALLKLVDCDEQPDLRTLERDVADFAGHHLYKPLKEIDIGKLLQDLLELLSQHRLAIPQVLFLMLKALTTWESVGRSLDPDFHIMERAAPFIRRVRTERMHPERIAGDVFDTSMELLRLAQEMPGELRELLLRLKQGKLKVELEHQGLEGMMARQDQARNRVAFSIVIAALVIGSALIV
ncbi:MAG: AarF/ABC1/UbiB kinase family protein, partial [Thermodesulfobacteriota bacterium]|nr:AarF/ABC1/UbiB kinase family protein [Thermodesulfobacteriota bacterium]